MVFGYLGEIVRENKTELTWLLGWAGDFVKLLARMQKIGLMISPIGQFKRLMNAYRQMRDFMFGKPFKEIGLKLGLTKRYTKGGYGGPDMWTRTPGYSKGMIDSWATEGASAGDVPWKKDERALASGTPWKGVAEEAKKSFDIMKTLAEETAQNMQQAFADFFFDAMTGEFKSLGDYLKGFLRSIAQTTSQILANILIRGAFSKLGMGSLIGMASGGVINEPVYGIGASGQSYAFGENGPEMVSPMGSGGGGNYNITINAIDAASFDTVVRRNPRSIIGVITDDMEMGGSMRSAMRGAM